MTFQDGFKFQDLPGFSMAVGTLSLPSTFREGDREDIGLGYIIGYDIYNRPIGHYLDMHMETAGQNDIPGKIYIQLNVQL